MNNNASVVYSVSVRLGGGGMGDAMLEMLLGLHEANLLKQAIVSSCKTDRLPRRLITQMGFWGRVLKRLSIYDPTGWLVTYIEARIFDRWANLVMQPARVFSSRPGMCFTCLKTAKQRGSDTMLLLGSAHPAAVLKWLNEERVRWGLSPEGETPIMRQVEQEFALADKIIVQSRFSQQSLVEHGLSPDKIIYLPPGVDVTHFRPADALPSGPFRVLFLGQVTLRKGIQYLLEAWKQLNWRDAELWIVGRVAPDSQPVLRHYDRLPGVRLMGYVPDQLTAFQNARVFVSPSVEDGFGHTVSEAMACGLPVVVSDHTGAADLVSHGESGFVVRYNDVTQYAQALETLRSSPEVGQRMGRAARTAAVAQTWDRYRKQWVAVHS